MTTKMLLIYLREQSAAKKNVAAMKERIEWLTQMPCEEVLRAFDFQDTETQRMIAGRVSGQEFADMLMLYADLKYRVGLIEIVLGLIPKDLADLAHDLFIEPIPRAEICAKHNLTKSQVSYRGERALQEIRRWFIEHETMYEKSGVMTPFENGVRHEVYKWPGTEFRDAIPPEPKAAVRTPDIHL